MPGVHLRPMRRFLERQPALLSQTLQICGEFRAETLFGRKHALTLRNAPC